MKLLSYEIGLQVCGKFGSQSVWFSILSFCVSRSPLLIFLFSLINIVLSIEITCLIATRKEGKVLFKEKRCTNLIKFLINLIHPPLRLSLGLTIGIRAWSPRD